MDEILTATFQVLTNTVSPVLQLIADHPVAFVALQVIAGTAAVFLGRRGRRTER